MDEVVSPFAERASVDENVADIHQLQLEMPLIYLQLRCFRVENIVVVQE